MSVRNQGIAASEIGFDGTDVTFGGVVIGTLAGGAAGADLTITFNASATSEAVDALIQNLTYANSSDTPTATRDYLLDILDAAGASAVNPQAMPLYVALTGVSNPFVNVSVFGGPEYAPDPRFSFADLDGDGDLDAVIGVYGSGELFAFRNGTDGTSGDFSAWGGPSPIDGANANDWHATPSFVDIDSDGDLDLIVYGDSYYSPTPRVFENDLGIFTELTGTTNPLAGVLITYPKLTFVDLDEDGDVDLVVGGQLDGTLLSFEHYGAGEFIELTGTANPLNGIYLDRSSVPRFVDLDGDGDLDMVANSSDGTIRSFTNDGAGVFTELTGAKNPFDGINIGDNMPSIVDLDGDGDLDLVAAVGTGTFETYENTTPIGVGFTVTITPENDAPTGSGLPVTITGNEDETFDVDLSGVQLNDPDSASVAFDLTIQV